jgi:CBS domain containing-hemolysin-like protein
MVPLKEVFMLEANSRLDADAIARIWQSGRSRIPVCDHDPTNIVGMLFTKDLLVVRAEDALPVRTVLSLYGQPVAKVWSDQHLDAIFTGTVLSSLFKYIFFL